MIDSNIWISTTHLGEYWIDANGGSKTDAFLVHCSFDDSVQTCIQPTLTTFEKVSFDFVKSGYKWTMSDDHVENGKVNIELLAWILESLVDIFESYLYHLVKKRNRIPYYLE